MSPAGKQEQLPSHFTAAKLKAYGDPLAMEQVSIRECEHGEILVRIRMSGVCHTDVHVRDGDWEFKGKLGVTLGHEGVGEVVKVGPGVSRLKIGERVCLPWLREACGCCTECVEGVESACPSVINAGFNADGAFAKYVYASEKYVGKVPDGLSDEQAAPITCAGVTVWRALKHANLKPGQVVAIPGAAGGLGHLAVQYAKTFGVDVIGIDAGEDKIKFLRQLGCKSAIDVKTTANLVEKVISESNGGCHAAIILVPSAQAIKQAAQYLAPRGTIVCVALPPGDIAASCIHIVVKELRIQGSIVGNRQDLREALEIAAKGLVKCQVEVRPFSQVNKCLDELKAGNIKGRLVLNLDA